MNKKQGRRSKSFSFLKLSTMCRQLESKNGNFRKKFPFLRRLYVKGGIPSPSPLHNPPMRVGTLPHGRRVVYSRAAPVSRGGPVVVARLDLSSSIARFFSSSLRGIAVRYAASSSCSVG